MHPSRIRITGPLFWLDRQIRKFIHHEQKLPRHLTQSVALEKSPLPHVVRVAVVLIGGLVGAFIIWAALTYLEEIASAAGQVVPRGHVQTIQHLEGGIVREILVSDGDLVQKGQLLLRLDDTSAGSDLAQIRAREQGLALHAERLRRFAGSNVSQSGNLTADENAILLSMEDARESQRTVLMEQLAQKEKQLSGLIGARESLRKNVVLMEKENAIKQAVTEKGYGSKVMALTSERELNHLKGQFEEASSQVNQAEDAVREAQSRLASLSADLKQEAMKNLGQVEAELAQVRKNLDKLEGTAGRTQIASPIRGIVKGLAVHTVGAVVESGKTLLEIVPVEREMMVEAMVQPSDVGYLHQNQRVRVKVSAYEFSRYGTAPGTLENVSATTFRTENGQAYFRARIRLDRTYVGNDPARNLILPGMTVQADIITGEHSVLQYLLKPIYVASDSALREH